MTDASHVSPGSPVTARVQWLTPVALVAALFAMSWWAFDRLPPTIVLRTLFSGRQGQPESAAYLAFVLPAIVAILVIGQLLAARWNVLVWPRKALASRDAAAHVFETRAEAMAFTDRRVPFFAESPKCR